MANAWGAKEHGQDTKTSRSRSHLGLSGGQRSHNGGQRAVFWLQAKVKAAEVSVWVVSFILPLALSWSIRAGSLLAPAKRSIRHLHLAQSLEHISPSNPTIPHHPTFCWQRHSLQCNLSYFKFQRSTFQYTALIGIKIELWVCGFPLSFFDVGLKVSTSLESVLLFPQFFR